MKSAWFGATDVVREFLADVGADKDEKGEFILLTDNGLVYGLGGDEVIVKEDATYYVDGEPYPLADGLHETQAGVKVQVF